MGMPPGIRPEMMGGLPSRGEMEARKAELLAQQAKDKKESKEKRAKSNSGRPGAGSIIAHEVVGLAGLIGTAFCDPNAVERTWGL